MAISYALAVANSRLQDVIDAVDGGSTAGLLVIGTTGLSGSVGVLATIVLQIPSYVVANKIATLQGVPLISQNAIAGGAAALAELRDGDGNTIVSGLSVGVSGANINLASTVVNVGQAVTINNGSMQSP